MFYIVQKNVFTRETNYDNLFKALEELNLDYEIVELTPDPNGIDFKTERKDVFVLGSVQLAYLAKKYDWEPGTFVDSHRFEFYKKFYGENLLNYDSQIVKYKDLLNIEGVKFIKPLEDNKLFTGQLFNQFKLNEFRSIIEKSNVNIDEEKLIVSDKKKLSSEIRFWIIGGKIATYSAYALNNVLNWDHLIIKDKHIDYCKKMILKHNLADAYTMDICELENEDMKIVELNCINGAGFYNADLKKMLISLENFFK